MLIQHSILETNLEIFASLACSRGFVYLGLLQPHAYSKYENLSDNELELLRIFEHSYKRIIGDGKNYSHKINKAFEEYSEVFK